MWDFAERHMGVAQGWLGEKMTTVGTCEYLPAPGQESHTMSTPHLGGSFPFDR